MTVLLIAIVALPPMLYLAECIGELKAEVEDLRERLDDLED